MSVEQVARDFISSMTDVEKTKAAFTPDATVGGGMFPQPMPAREGLAVVSELKSGFPDLKFDVRQVTVNGNQATVQTQLSGTNTRELRLSLPGVPVIPVTGKKASVQDAYIVTVQGDKVSHLQIDSPPGGGLPALLGQIGVKLPGM